MSSLPQNIVVKRSRSVGHVPVLRLSGSTGVPIVINVQVGVMTTQTIRQPCHNCNSIRYLVIAQKVRIQPLSASLSRLLL